VRLTVFIFCPATHTPAALDESDIQILKTYVRADLRSLRRFRLTLVYQGQGPYATQLKKTESDIKEVQKRINEKLGS
jgi:26S proteasome regulatory subunit T1